MNEKRMAMKGEEGWTAQDDYHISKIVDLFASRFRGEFRKGAV